MPHKIHSYVIPAAFTVGMIALMLLCALAACTTSPAAVADVALEATLEPTEVVVPPGYCPCTPTPEPTATCPAYCGVPPTATPAVEATATATAVPPAILWDQRLTDLGITVMQRNGNYRMVAAWLTINGQWDDVPEWAHRWQQDTLGGDHHLFGRLETPAGVAIMDKSFFIAWPQPNYTAGDSRVPEPDGWANIPMAGQNWQPANGPGPYDWWVDSGDKLVGLGMPWNYHYSFFAVWQPR